MKNTIRLMLIGTMVCTFGCNKTTTVTGTPSADTQAKQNSQQKPASPGNSEKSAAPATSVVPTTALEGTWKTGCVSKGTVYLESAVTVTGSQGYAEGAVYSDSACTKAYPGVTWSQEWMTITVGKADPKTGLVQFSDVKVDEQGNKTTEYNVFEITGGDTLTIGQASTDADDYPSATDPSLVYKKQAKEDAIPPQPASN